MVKHAKDGIGRCLQFFRCQLQCLRKGHRPIGNAEDADEPKVIQLLIPQAQGTADADDRLIGGLCDLSDTGRYLAKHRLCIALSFSRDEKITVRRLPGQRTVRQKQFDSRIHLRPQQTDQHRADTTGGTAPFKAVQIDLAIPADLIALIVHGPIQALQLIGVQSLLAAKGIGCPFFSQQMILHITGDDQFQTFQSV